MKNFIDVLKRTKLFSGVSEEEILLMSSCLDAKLKEYKKGEYVFRQGQHISQITVLLKGNLHIQKDDYWGNRTIVNNISVGEIFGEAYIAPESGALLNDVVAVEDSSVAFFDVKKIITAYRVPTRDFFGKAVLFKSQAWREATPFLVLFNFLHLINHQNRVNLLLQLNCR